MSLKSIRESYSNLIQAFTEAGVALNESQKSSLDTFVVALESKMSKQKEATVKATKKVVTEHLEKQYKELFESIMKHQAENAALASKIQSKTQSIKESKKIAKAVDNYLDLYVESVLPKKTIVDYDRMQKLEKIHESLKDMLVVDEEAVQTKQAQLQESFNKDKKALETQIAKLQVKLNESMATSQKLNSKINSFKAEKLLESKTADLPTFEARKMKKRFAHASEAEIEKNFAKVLESVQADDKADEAEVQKELEEEIKDIIENDVEVKEDDMLKNKPHNNHVSEKEDEENKEVEECGDKDYETMESYKYDSDGDIVLESDDVINDAWMKSLCESVQRYSQK